MERRWTARTKLDIDVDVLLNNNVSIQCKTGDIGLGGVYLNFLSSTPVSKGDTVELTFKLNLHRNEACKLRAKVIRLTEQGAGLMFKDFDAIAFRSLQQVMKAPSKVSAL